MTVTGGNWLLREGEEGETMYVVRSGQLDIVSEDPPETVIRTVRRGPVVGELALHVGRRTASVRACRDSELLEFSRPQFEQLIRKEPSFAIAMTQPMGAQLAVSKSPVQFPPPPPTIVGLMDRKRLGEVREIGQQAALESLERMEEVPWAA